MSDSAPNSSNEEIASYLELSLSSAEPFTAQEYFTILLSRAAEASRAGDYGIAAALVLRLNGIELVSIARNTAISESDPFGHAEANAIRNLREFLRRDADNSASKPLAWVDSRAVAKSSGNIYVRPISQTPVTSESIIYTTLEPCPMCAVAILNSRIQQVVIATPDEPGGVLAPERLAKLPGMWPQIAASQHLVVRFTASQPGEASEAYLPSTLAGLLKRVFWDTKDSRDAELSNGVLFNLTMSSDLNSLVQVTPPIEEGD